MTIAAAITVNGILTRVAVETGLESVADPFGSPLQHYIQLRNLLQVAGEQLCLAFPWEFLVAQLDIATVESTNKYALPGDFQSMIDQSGWNNTTEQPIIGPLSSQEWNAIKGTSTQNLIRYAFRIFEGQIQVYPNPPADGMDLSFEYQSRGFVRRIGIPAVPEESIASGDDTILFDRTLITRFLKLLWFEAKGFDTTSAQASFNQTFQALTGKDRGGRILDAGGNIGGIRYLDYSNIPLSGYGG